jgi:Fe-S-cluster containining protein
VLPPIDPDDEGDFGLWSLLDLGKQRARIEERGTLKGLARALVPADCLDIVRRRAERDSEHPEPTRTVDFDCLACGACCRDNEVVLFEDDVTRLKEGGHAKLTRPPYARRRKGKLVLTLLANKSCRQLGKDNACAIYASRPAACRDFPMGSECCLYSREAEFGWVDGVAAGA